MNPLELMNSCGLHSEEWKLLVKLECVAKRMSLHFSNKIKRNNDNLIVTSSWDDGSESDMKLCKLLKKYSVKSTFYITKSYRYLERPLTVPEIIELDKNHEIGAHTLTHPDLDKVDYITTSEEIFGSKKYLESFLCHDVKMFSYPRGRYNNEIIKTVKKAGFIGARTSNHNNFSKINEPYEWQITLQASNCSPLMTLKTYLNNYLSLKSLINWETRAKELFDLALKTGGVYHIWGHASEFEKKNEWSKIEEVLSYISNREGVRYMTNGEAVEALYNIK
jgi:peptidoglycan-N-acetylglucosamine deacetylase